MVTPQRRYNKSLRGKYRVGKHRAKKKGIPWQITFTEYAILLTQAQCHYCQGPLNPNGSGLDRLDSSLGYTVPNVVTCCSPCNMVKGDNLTVKEMRIISYVLKLLREPD